MTNRQEDAMGESTDLGQNGPSRICGVKRCRRVARVAFDVYDPWRATYVGVGTPAPDTPIQHYEVCDQHAREFWPRDGGYVEKRLAERIRDRVVAS